MRDAVPLFNACSLAFPSEALLYSSAVNGDFHAVLLTHYPRQDVALELAASIVQGQEEKARRKVEKSRSAHTAEVSTVWPRPHGVILVHANRNA